MSFVVPLKVKSGVIRNIKQLCEIFNAEYGEILKFIETGQLERFFQDLHRRDLKDIIVSMKKEGKNSVEIARQLANILKIKLQIAEDLCLLEDLVKPTDDLSELLRSKRVSLNLPSGKWSVGETLITSSKKITGSGCDKTGLLLDKSIIDIASNQELVFESITFKSLNKIV